MMTLYQMLVGRRLTQQGEKYLTTEEADDVGFGPTKPVTATLDLYEAIEKGEPSYKNNIKSIGGFRLSCLSQPLV